MSTTSTNYSFGGVATTATTLGMAGVLLLGGAAAGAPAMAADAAPAGEVSAAVAGSHSSAGQVVLHAPSAATTGDSIALTGKVKKNHHHKTRVVIQKKHGKKWQKVDTTKTNKKGKFHTADAFGKKNKVTLRAKATGHGFSNTQTVTFTKASNGGGTSDGGGITPPPNNGGGTGDGGGTLPPNHGGGTGDGGDVTPPSDPMQVYVPEGDTQGLLDAIDQAPNGATLHLSGEYNVSNKGHEIIYDETGQRHDWYSGIVVNKALTLDGGKLQSDGEADVVDVGPQGDLTLEGGINITGGYGDTGSAGHGTGGGIYDAGNVTLNDGYIWGNDAGQDTKSGTTLGGGVYITNTGTFTMNGGRIDKNHAMGGGGVYVEVGGQLYIYGNAEIENNSHGGVFSEMHGGNDSGAVSDENGWVINPDGGWATASWHIHDNTPPNIRARNTV